MTTSVPTTSVAAAPIAGPEGPAARTNHKPAPKPRAKAAPKAAPALPLTSISKYRALVLVLATSLGFTHKQESSQVDIYSKGSTSILLQWGHGQLLGGARVEQGKVVAEVKAEQNLKLQRMQHQLFKAPEKGKALSDLQWKWSKLTSKQVTDLEALAKAQFKAL